jgi:hypothetical protein
MTIRLFKHPNLRLWVPWAMIPVGAVVASWAWTLYLSRGSGVAAGTYLMAGGQSYAVIESRSLGRLAVRESRDIQVTSFAALRGQSLSAWLRRGDLFLSQTSRPDVDPARGLLAIGGKVLLFMRLEPSSSVPGDWDLVEAHAEAKWPSKFTPAFWRIAIGLYGIGGGTMTATVKAAIVGVFSGRFPPPPVDARLDTTMPPVRSFLHRVDDARIPDYFRDRYSNDPTVRTLTAIRSLAADHPLDPYLSLHRIDVEAAVGDSAEALRLMKEWDRKNPSPADALLAKSARRVRLAVFMAENKRLAPDLHTMMEMFPAQTSPVPLSERDWESKTRWVRSIDALPYLWVEGDMTGLIPAFVRSGAALATRPVPNFLELQIFCKVARATAMLRLVQGRREEALELLTGSYRLGQCMNADGVLIVRLIGIALRAIATSGLGIYALNACETPGDLEKTWAEIERLDETPGQEDGRHLTDGEDSPLRSLMTDYSMYAANLLEARTRHDVTDAKFQALRAGVAARHRFLRTGQFPRSAAEFDLFGVEGLPADDFAPTQTLRFILPEKGEFTVYSVGPDGDDDRAETTYDSSNGSTSDGDLSLAIPREREIPFPKEGVRAATAKDFLRQLPNGLPLDPFSSKKGRPLSIIDSTTTQPVVVFSFGPDGDEDRSGTRVPYYGGAGAGVLPPTGPGLQLVFERSALTPEAQTKAFEEGKIEKLEWALQPYYDPTNGATSAGDLFIEIPIEGRDGIPGTAR